MSDIGVNERAIDSVASLYRHVIAETILSHEDVSRLITNLISLFFIEKAHIGSDWHRVESALDSHDPIILSSIDNPITVIDNASELLESIPESAWSFIDACRIVDWSSVSPLVFGSAFQGILEMDSKEVTEELNHGGGKRREFGAHYTSEENILRVIRPLFLDELSREATESPVEPFLKRISSLKILDPAAGCASFLVVIYRELKRLEFTALERIQRDKTAADYSVNIGQLYGIEINPEAALVAHLALSITEHQMDIEAVERFGVGQAFTAGSHITVGNALRVDWQSVLPSESCDYIVGNPPFRGALKMTKSQKSDMKAVGVESGIKSWNALDLVAAWFVKAAVYVNRDVGHEESGLFDLWEEKPVIEESLRSASSPKIAFVATNSVSQGLHIPNLWSWMFERDMEIGFAYPSFRWDNEAAGHASVTVVIIGFGRIGTFQTKHIYSNNEDRIVDFINGGLTPLNVGAVEPVRGRVLSAGIPNAELGNLPRGKAFVISTAERKAAVESNPALEKWIPLFVGADELTKNGEQYCLWLVDAPDSILQDPFVSSRTDAIREQRLLSSKKETRDAASTPELFDEIRQPERAYLAIPTSSSGNRKYIPMKFLPASTIASNALKTITGATPYHFAVLSSSMHMAWMRNTSARLGGGNDYSYSVASTYNTLPWLDADEWTTAAISALGSEVLAVRDRHSELPLGKMYTSMPEDLVTAHDKLDALIDASYGYTGDGSDESRFEFLYHRYAALIA